MVTQNPVFRALQKQRGYIMGISLSICRGGRVTAPSVATGFLLLANGVDRLLLADGTSKFQRVS